MARCVWGALLPLVLVLLALIRAGSAAPGEGPERGRMQSAAAGGDGGVGGAVELRMGFTNQVTEKEVKVQKGGTVKLILDSNPTTGYKWFLNGIEGAAVKKDSSEYTAPAATGMVGGGGVDVWNFKAEQAGTSKVVLDYKRPWEETPASQAVVTVDVE